MWKALYLCAWILGNIVNKLTLTNRLHNVVSTTQRFSIIHVTLVMLYHHTVRGK